MTFKNVTIVLSLLSLVVVFFIVRYYKTTESVFIHDAKIVNKLYEKAYVSTSFTTISTGKVMMTVPNQIHHPEEYTLILEGYYFDLLCKSYVVVGELEYNKYKLGDKYERGFTVRVKKEYIRDGQ